ncbi:MAG: hypothetical protein ACRDRT_15085, partial [Pseudonocardiaceae bacterium]
MALKVDSCDADKASLACLDFRHPRQMTITVEPSTAPRRHMGERRARATAPPPTTASAAKPRPDRRT